MKFTIPGEPQGKARGRTFIHNYTGKATTLTPEKTVLYENLIRVIFNKSKTDTYKLFNEPVQMVIWAYYGIPKSKSKKVQHEMREGNIYPIKKPDLDNICKVVCDALNGHAYKDDTQVVGINMIKAYSDNPRVEVELYEVKNG